MRLPMLHRQLDLSRLTAVSCSGIMITYSYDSIELSFCLGELTSRCFCALNRNLFPVSDRQRCCRTMFIFCLRRRFPQPGALFSQLLFHGRDFATCFIDYDLTIQVFLTVTMPMLMSKDAGLFCACIIDHVERLTIRIWDRSPSASDIGLYPL